MNYTQWIDLEITRTNRKTRIGLWLSVIWRQSADIFELQQIFLIFMCGDMSDYGVYFVIASNINSNHILTREYAN